MIRIFLSHNPRKLIVTKETEKEVRADFRNIELVNTYKNNRGVHAFVRKMMKTYNVPVEDVVVRFFMFWGLTEGRNTVKSEQWLANIRASLIGRKLSEEHKAKIGALHRGKKKNFSPEFRAYLRERTKRLATEKLKQMGRLRWIYEPYTGEASRISEFAQLPEGWMYGRPSVKEFIHSTKAPGKRTRLTTLS